MAENSKIQWTHHTWNPWRGCQHATLPNGSPHPGCLNCYAEIGSVRNPKILGEWGAEGTRIKAAPATFSAPFRWNEKAKEAGQRHRVFVDSYSDFFEAWRGPVSDHHGFTLSPDGRPLVYDDLLRKPRGEVMTLDDLRRAAWETIQQCDWLDFLILTKRPQNIRPMWPTSLMPYRKRDGSTGVYCRVANVWLLYSAGDQASLEAGVPALLKCRDLAPVLGVSAEPLVGAIDFSGLTNPTGANTSCLDWVIVGGESGRGARPCSVEWIRSTVRQCKGAGVPCFVKQLGSNVWTHGAVKHLEDKKGGNPSEWPRDLRVREFP